MKTLWLLAGCVLVNSTTAARADDMYAQYMQPEDPILVCDDPDDASRLGRNELPEGEFQCRKVLIKSLDQPPIRLRWIVEGQVVSGELNVPFKVRALWIVHVDGQKLWGVWPLQEQEEDPSKKDDEVPVPQRKRAPVFSGAQVIPA